MLFNIKIPQEIPAFERFPLHDVNRLGGTKKQRWICDPNEAMRDIHKQFIEYLRGLSVDLSSSTSGRLGDSPLKNVLRHCKNRYFYLTDISDAYGGVGEQRLTETLVSIDPSLEIYEQSEITSFLSAYCFVPEGGLGQGFPASQDLFNCYAAVEIDSKMRELAEKYGITYSRYLDDLTFSSQEPIGARKRKKFRKIIMEAGFEISHHKSKVLDLSKGEVFINGVGISQDGSIFLRREYLNRLNGHIHLASKGEIKPEVVEGMMGLFKFLTKKPFNRTEQKTWKRYKRFREIIGARS